ncbi:MAG: ATP-grasp fold amidoligase family protein [Verrucomicrobiae bacterium]|nr:ATP-grasp fold amidoligase family protein [Verrucomicrobiae bacterium]
MGLFRESRRKLKLNRSALLARLPLHWKYVLRYKAIHQEVCLLFRPKTFNQKLYYKMIYDRRPLLAVFADKLQAREYVRRMIGADILVGLLAVTNRPEDLPFDRLPAQFVLKTNHGSGFVRIVKNQLLEDRSELRRLCGRWLAVNYGDLTGEWVYQKIDPQIMVENFLCSPDGEPPVDYKFFVFNGKVFMIQTDVGRFTDHRRDLFSPDWKRLEVRYTFPNGLQPVPKPGCLRQMLAIAERLGAETDFVRVDLYEVGGRVYFGELTNFPECGSNRFEPKSFDAVLGAQWRLGRY